MGTPHNQAKQGEIAKIVLMPGDPLRAQFIAHTYLEEPKQFNAVRNMFGYTGTYKGKQISIMGSGMGMPSIGIYSYELFSMYDVEAIIRIGSAGAYVSELKLFDLVLADSAWSESSYAKAQSGATYDVSRPDPELNMIIEQTAHKMKKELCVSRIHSSDVFYSEPGMPAYEDFYREHGCRCVEMESFALFHNAAVLGKKAACLLTISDSLVSSEATTPQQRQEAFHQMMELALESAAVYLQKQERK